VFSLSANLSVRRKFDSAFFPNSVTIDASPMTLFRPTRVTASLSPPRLVFLIRYFYPHRKAAAEHSVSDELLQLPGHYHDSARVHALQAVHVRHEHVLRVATTEELVLDDLVVEAVGYPGLAAPNF